MNEFFYICHHESQRQYAVDGDVLHAADKRGYNAVTAPITKPNYQARILSELSSVERSSDETVFSSSTVPFLQLQQLSNGETDLIPAETNTRVLWTTSTWIDLCSPDALIRDVSRQVLQQEVSYAAFCGATNIIVRGPRPRDDCLYHSSVIQFARYLRTALELAPNVHFNVELPIVYSSEDSSEAELGDLVTFASAKDENHENHGTFDLESQLSGWDVWHTIRHVSGYNPRLLLTLTLRGRLPLTHIRNRWFSEPIGAFHLPKSAFAVNRMGIDALDRPAQDMIIRSMQLKNPPWVILSDVAPIPGYESLSTVNGDFEGLNLEQNPTPAEACSGTVKSPPSSEHVDYFREHLQKRLLQYSPSEMESYGAGWQDYLQNPLQPLTDNLESIQYEVFEKDPVKYEWYERAIAAALLDWKQLKKQPSGLNGEVVVAVTGAGRGPLVTRALQASKSTGIDIDMWALEKNPSAFVLLQRQNRTTWQSRVHLVHSDMRSWSGPCYEKSTTEDATSLTGDKGQLQTYHIDILVSELLGSFGDNELSPECIDGVQHLLNPEYGVSIPQRYSAFLTPVAAPKLHTDISMKSHSGEPHAAHVPYVVMLQAIDYLSPKATYSGRSLKTSEQPLHFEPTVQEAWSFIHPNKRLASQSAQAFQTNVHNTRSVSLQFECHTRGICTGLAGYFESALYVPETSEAMDYISAAAGNAPDDTGDEETPRVELSTNPLTAASKSMDMISWFPIYFPLQTPLYVPDDSQIQINMWRQTDGKKVWYEWLVEISTWIRGFQERLGGSELHSSIKDACLM